MKTYKMSVKKAIINKVENGIINKEQTRKMVEVVETIAVKELNEQVIAFFMEDFFDSVTGYPTMITFATEIPSIIYSRYENEEGEHLQSGKECNLVTYFIDYKEITNEKEYKKEFEKLIDTHNIV